MNSFFSEEEFKRGKFPCGPGWHMPHGRVQRGDMSPIILHVLKEKSMHGYEIIRTLEERTHGFWRPSAGSVYPTLQLLEEQELIVGKEEGGKKIYSVTDRGLKEVGENPFQHPLVRRRHSAGQFNELREIFPDIIKTLKTIAFSGSESELKEAKKILEETRRQLHDLQAKNV